MRNNMVSIIKRNRILKNEDEVFTQNAWDDVEWTEDMINNAEKRIQEQREESKKGSKINIEDVEPQVCEKWDKFYEAHGDKFFKDRCWLFSEFPELLDCLNVNHTASKILEIGCGVGNAVAYMLKANENTNLHLYCCDISEKAIETLKKRDIYLNSSNNITCFQADICTNFNDKLCANIEVNSLDIITVIFTLSALKPELIQNTVCNLSKLLKIGGLILFRDYAQYDLTQLRFKGRAYLKDNYYIRSDGTTSFFFTKQFVDNIFTEAGLTRIELKEDNRMLVNRSKSIKMCRRWLQAKYRRDE